MENDSTLTPSALRCPSCGSADSNNAREVRFGYEVKCKYCGTASVLIINRKLYVPSPGEHVCTACGRVAGTKARFCQCGASLVRQCISCLHEFPTDHVLCDYCGWPQEILPESPDGNVIRTERALAELNSVDRKKQQKAIVELGKVAPPNPAIEILVFMFICGHGLSPEQHNALFIKWPRVWEVLWHHEFLSYAEKEPEMAWFVALSKLASKYPLEMLTVLKAALSDTRSFKSGIIRLLAHCGAPAVSILVPFLSDNDHYSEASESLRFVGAEALPALKELTGFFAPLLLKERAKKTIDAIKRVL